MPFDNGILTGVRVRLEVQRINAGITTTLGLLTDVTISDGIDWAAIKVIGSLPTAEFAPVDYNVTIDCGKLYRLPAGVKNQGGEATNSAGSLVEEQIFPASGTTDEEFLLNVVNMSTGLNGRVITTTGIVLGQLDGMLPAQRVLRVPANALVTNHLTFVARMFKQVPTV